MSNFSFSHSVFKILVQQTRKNQGLFGKGLNATLTAEVMGVGDAYVFPGFLTPVLTQFAFQSHRLIFSHASEVSGENTPERNSASTGDQTHNQQVKSQTRSPLSDPGGL